MSIKFVNCRNPLEAGQKFNLASGTMGAGSLNSRNPLEAGQKFNWLASRVNAAAT